MTGSGENGDDDASRGDAGDGHGHCRGVQPATSLLTFGHGTRDLALPGGRGLFLPVVHVIQSYFPRLRIPLENG